MGKFYVHKNGVVRWQGICPDGDEALQAPAGYNYGLGDPPAGMMPDARLPQHGYDVQRVRAYPGIGDQLDALWHAMDDGRLPQIEPFYSDILAVKEQFPKPSN